MASGSDGHSQPPQAPREGYRGRDLTGTDFSGADLKGVNFIQANLSQATLTGADLTTARMHGARLRGADLSNVSAEGLGGREVDLEGARLTGAQLQAALLAEAVLLDADLTGAVLQKADLRGADLRSANFTGADLSEADLSGADLSGADFTDVILTGVRARGARIARLKGISEEGRQALLDAGASSGTLQQLSRTLRDARSRLSSRAQDLRPTSPAPTEEEASSSEGILTEWQSRTAALQKNWKESRQRAAEARQRQEDAWKARRASEADERRYRRENREEYRKEQEERARRAKEALRAERRRLQQRRRAEKAIEQQTSHLLRQIHLEARQRVEDKARKEAEEIARQQAEVDAREQATARARLQAEQFVALQQAEGLRRIAEGTRKRADQLTESVRSLAEEERRQAGLVEGLSGDLARQQRQLDAIQRRLLLLDREHHTAAEDAQAELTARIAGTREEEATTTAQLGTARTTLDAAEAALAQLRERLETTREKADTARQQAAGEEARAADALREAGAQLPAPPKQGLVRRLTDRSWFTLTDRIGRQSPTLANTLDGSRERLLTLPSRVRQRWWREEAAADESARARIRRRLGRLRPGESGSIESRAEEAARLQSALSRTEGSGIPQTAEEIDVSSGPLKRTVDAIWYRGTDLIAAISRPLAERLDSIKERMEWEFVSRRAEANRLLEQQRREVEEARSTQRRQERSARIERLQRLRDREEVRAEKRAVQEARKAEDRAKRQRMIELRSLTDAERHEHRRAHYSTQTDRTALDHRGADMRGQKLTEVEWADADLQDARLDNARLDNADLTAANLQDVSLAGARLDGATLDGANLDHATLDGARLRRVSLLGAQLSNARLVDVDLRGADLTGADLTGADLTGADLRQASLFGATFLRANLTAARMPELDLEGVILDSATLDQADLAGVRWDGASVDQADLSGALGLSGATREQLAQRGALAGDVALDDLFSRLGSRQVRVAAAVLLLGVGAFLTTSYLTTDTFDSAALEGQAEELRGADPLAASALYLQLAESGTRIEERISYLIEAAVLADQGGDAAQAGTLFTRALDEAGDDQTLAARVRMRRAGFYADHGRWEDAQEAIDPVLFITGQPTEQRARAVLLYERICAELEQPPERLDAVFAELSDLPDAEAELRMSLAEVRSAQGAIDAAMAELSLIEGLTISSDLSLRVLETRSRVQDRGGDLAGSAESLAALLDAAEDGSLMSQAASLQLADLKQRLGETTEALAIVEGLLAAEPDPRIQGRALLVVARIHETGEDIASAADAYQTLLAAEGLDQEVVEEARMGLARILLSDGGAEAVQAALSELPPEYADQILGQARLGDARRMLDEGDPAAARDLYEELLDSDQLTAALRRAARSGLGEAYSALGSAAEAEAIWQELLADNPPPSERVYVELLLASGLLQSGKLEQAETAFASLADSSDLEIATQGMLGLAEVARAGNERERARGLYQDVVDSADDPAWQTQALQELADLALEEDNLDDAMTAWRTVIGLVPAGDPSGTNARLALVSALAERGSVEQVQQHCDEATTSPDAVSIWQTCAEALERVERPDAALATWTRLLDTDSRTALDDDVFAEASLGAARLLLAQGRGEEAMSRCAEGLDRSSDPAVKMLLLSTRIAAAEVLGDANVLAAAIAQRDEMAAATPRLAGAILLESAQQARGADDPTRAISLLQQAASLDLQDDLADSVALELGGALMDSGALADAEAPLTRAAASADPHTAFAAGMSLAEWSRRSGDVPAALVTLSELTPPDDDSRRWWMEARASAMTEVGDPGAAEAWEELAEAGATDPGMQSASLRGKADTLFSQDLFEESLALYREAASVAVEPSMAGWAQLGEAEALRHMTEVDAARTLLTDLSAHDDPEVSLQAAVVRARLELESEQSEAALAALEGREADGMGPAWDATLCETRVAALQSAGRHAEARAELQRLADRWPDEEEAQLPAWLGLADLARDDNNPEDARRWAALALNSAQDPVYRDRAQALVDQLSGE